MKKNINFDHLSCTRPNTSLSPKLNLDLKDLKVKNGEACITGDTNSNQILPQTPLVKYFSFIITKELKM